MTGLVLRLYFFSIAMISEKLNSSLIVCFFKKYKAVIISFLILMVAGGIHLSFGIFLKPILLDLGWTRAVTSGAFSISSLAMGFGGVFWGWMTDRYGIRIVLSICGLVAGIGYLLLAQISGLWQFYLFYGLFVGVGSATFAPLMSTVSRLYIKRRTFISGIVSVSLGIGMTIMPLLSNQLISVFGWRMSFVILGIMVFVVTVLSAQFFKQNLNDTGQSIVSNAEETIEKSAENSKTFTLRSAMVTRQFWIIFTMFFCLGFIVTIFHTHFFSYLTDINISAPMAANITAFIGASSIIGRTALGNIGDRIGNRKAIIIGFILLAVPMFYLSFAREVWVLFLIAFVFGIGYGDCVASETPLTAKVFGLKSLGLIFGVFTAAYTIGGAACPVVVGYLFDITLNYRAGFMLTAIIGLIGFLLMLCLSPIKTKS